MQSHNKPIPKDKLGIFDEILKSCGGRYLRNPIKAPDQYGYWRVSYEYDDVDKANEHNRRWRNVTEDLVEKPKKASLWRRVFP